MLLINADKQMQVFDPSQLILSKIKRALKGLSSHVTLVQAESHAALFSVLLKEKKNSDLKLWSDWQISVQHSLQITISLTNPHQHFLPPDPAIAAADLLLKLNRESVFGTYFAVDFPLLSFRHCLGSQNNNKFVGAAISELFWQVSQQFAKWVLKLKLGGEQKCKSSKMYHCVKRMRYMKQFFENERLNRSKSLKVYDLSHSNIKVVEEAIRVISYHSALLKNHRATEIKKNQPLLQIYKKEYDSLGKEMAPQTQQPKNFIMRGIEISRIIDERKIDEGGFSQIYRGEYIVGVLVTINAKQPAAEVGRKLLVKKVPKTNLTHDDSFKNEINLLKFIRGEKDSRIAGYYFMLNQHERLYIDYYEHNLLVASQNWTETQLLATAKQLLEGLTFLANRNLLHRDLKELNILIDSHNHSKIIDFGSSCAVYKQQPSPGDYEAISNALMSTKGYYFSYNSIEANCPNIAKQFTRDQYNRAANFDLFSIGTILRNLFTLGRCFDSMFYRQLTYLADKCQERNPEDRLTSFQAEAYLYLLTQLYRLENEETSKVSLRSVESEKEQQPSGDLYNTA